MGSVAQLWDRLRNYGIANPVFNASIGYRCFFKGPQVARVILRKGEPPPNPLLDLAPDVYAEASLRSLTAEAAES